jgi:signal transduction histidine kinase
MHASEVRIRSARPSEASILTRIAAAAKRHWGYDDEFMARFSDVIALDLPPALPPARVDADRLDQVVRNLLLNAIGHSAPGGLVRVAAAAGTGDDVVIRVDDTGSGIADDDLPRIWDRFYRGGTAEDRDAGGAGVGLALVKELTEAMGGRVSVANVVGGGASFEVHVPLA